MTIRAPPPPASSFSTVKPGVPAEGGEVAFRLRVLAPADTDGRERPRLNLGLVLDRSGSMSGLPLDHAKHAASMAIAQLDPDDTVSVVAYDDSVDVVVPSTPVVGRAAILGTVSRIESGGRTALHAGWLEGATQVASKLGREGLSRVVLLSDGFANVGETDPRVIAGDAEALAVEGVNTSVIGLGRGFNEDLLETMAMSGGGNYYLVEVAEQLESILAAELRGLTATSGRHVRLAFRHTGSGARVSAILNDLDLDGEALRLPDLIAGLPQEVAGTLQVPAREPGEIELGTVVLQWEDVDGHPFELSMPIRTLALDPNAYAAAPSDTTVQALVEELKIARLKQEATRALDAGDRAAAAGLVDRAQRWLDALPESARSDREVSDLASLRIAMTMKDDIMARKRMKAQAYRRHRSYYHEKLDAAYPHGKGTDAENVRVTRADGSEGLIELILGDITDERVDGLLNPTNPGLFGTGRTVDGAIHRRGGRALTRACREIGRVDVGHAVATPGFGLPVSYVLHTAVPMWDGGAGKARVLLAECYRSVFRLAARMNLRNLAVPAVGAGSNRFPPEVAAEVALEEIRGHLEGSDPPTHVRVVLYESWMRQLYIDVAGRAAAPA